MRAGRRAAALVLLAAGACAHAPAREPRSLQDGSFAMGTALELTLYGADSATLAGARDAVFAEVRRLDGLLSNWSDDSEVSRINRAAGSGAQPVDSAVADLLAASQRYSAATLGSFDVTVGPLVELWTRAGERNALPSPAEIALARARVGAARLRVGPGAQALLPAGMAIDLGGVAKGFALDRALPILRQAGIGAALLEFGQSSTFALGAPPDSPQGWHLLVRGADGGFDGVLTLRDVALSASGSLGQWTEIEGRRFGHIVDPRSGLPLERRRLAVVLAPDATLAEALSKALLVLGETQGLDVVRAQPGCEALLLDADGERFSTPGWQAATGYRPLAAPTAPGDAD